MITLGDIRKAGEGLPDETPVRLSIVNDPPHYIAIEFYSVDGCKHEITITAEAHTEDEEEEDE